MTPTPGPWAFDGEWIYVPPAGEPDRILLSGVVAKVIIGPSGAATRDANGTLIAAAPAMLAALHAVWILAETLDIGNFERARIREAVSAVIDQAEGRTPAGTP